MAEIGLLPLARVALEVATRVLPPYRSRFSKHQFTQPSLLAVLCLMRYEDWTFREAEVRLREHGELREVLRLAQTPDYTTLYRFLQRLEDDTIDRALGETVRRLRRRRSARVTAGVDGTGLSHNAVSTFFIRRMEQHARGMTQHRHWLKWLIVAELRQQIVLAQHARQGPWGDTRAAGTAGCGRGTCPLWQRCWPMPSLIPKPIINTSASAAEPSASSQPFVAAAFPMAPSATRCTADFHGSAMHNAPRSKRSFRWSNENLFPRPGPHPGFANPPSVVARPYLQPLSFETSYLPPEDVNRAISNLKLPFPL